MQQPRGQVQARPGVVGDQGEAVLLPEPGKGRVHCPSLGFGCGCWGSRIWQGFGAGPAIGEDAGAAAAQDQQPQSGPESRAVGQA